MKLSRDRMQLLNGIDSADWSINMHFALRFCLSIVPVHLKNESLLNEMDIKVLLF